MLIKMKAYGGFVLQLRDKAFEKAMEIWKSKKENEEEKKDDSGKNDSASAIKTKVVQEKLPEVKRMNDESPSMVDEESELTPI